MGTGCQVRWTIASKRERAPALAAAPSGSFALVSVLFRCRSSTRVSFGPVHLVPEARWQRGILAVLG
eukprot:7916781-Pyramimonas_sp.AAC.1